jgi:hypothetical protein
METESSLQKSCFLKRKHDRIVMTNPWLSTNIYEVCIENDKKKNLSYILMTKNSPINSDVLEYTAVYI